ncbi:MAG: DUF1574 family protein [Anaerolineales bacterium]|nr:DUF1574 family protein [Anaerolineales bacterium]
MKRLLSKLALLFVPVFLLVGLVNYVVDPSLLFGIGRVEREMAQAMLNGQNIANILNYDHRLLQKFYFAGLQQTPDMVVLGSSRSMLVRASYFPGRHLYNAAVAGGSVEDFLAIDQVMRNNGHRPETVILDISPWVFNRENGQTRWRSLASEYFQALDRLGIDHGLDEYWRSLDVEKYSALFSLPYLQESLRWANRENSYYFTTRSHTGEVLKLSDGSRVYGDEEEKRSAAELQKLVSTAVDNLSPFNQLDPFFMQVFETFVAGLQAEGVEVVFFLAPYPPAMYTADAMQPSAQAVEQYLHSFAAQHGITVVGSYDPAALGCDASEFYDAVHPRPSCIAKLGLEALDGRH